MRVVLTGGSGKAGRHVIPYLLNQGHQILNLDLIPFPEQRKGVYTLKTDLTDSGQVFNAFSTQFSLDEFTLPKIEPPDAIVHLAAHARNGLVPDNVTFAANTQSTYNVIEAACKLGIKKVIIASSETVYGVCFAQGDDVYYESFPLHEDLVVNPPDSYACSKVCGEATARSFARRFGVDIYVLRIGNVIEPHEYAQNFPGYLADPGSRMRNAWSYIDARDLGQICDLCLKKNGLGFQIFNAVNDNITLHEKTADVLKKYSPKSTMNREMGEIEGPLSNKKIRDVLGFKQNHDWRDCINEKQ